MIYFGLVLSSIIELLECLIDFGVFYFLLIWLFLFVLVYVIYIGYCGILGWLLIFGLSVKCFGGVVVFFILLMVLSIMVSDDFVYLGKCMLNMMSIYLMLLIVYLYFFVNFEKYLLNVLLKRMGKVIVYSGLFVVLFGFL